jgi:hypothetical protein
VVRKWESRKESLINAKFDFIMVATTLSALCLLVVTPYDSYHDNDSVVGGIPYDVYNFFLCAPFALKGHEAVQQLKTDVLAMTSKVLYLMCFVIQI